MQWFSTIERFLVILAASCAGFPITQFYFEADDRDRQRHATAWSLIYLAEGKRGDGGRSMALKILNDDRVDLNGVPLRGASLRELCLPGARFKRAELQDVDLSYSYLARSSFFKADLTDAKLYVADLSGSDFRQATLHRADLVCANLYSARNLEETALAGAELCKTIMPDGTVSDRDCAKTDLGDRECPAAKLTPQPKTLWFAEPFTAAKDDQVCPI